MRQDVMNIVVTTNDEYDRYATFENRAVHSSLQIAQKRR
jgi:hypothetical protein